MPLRKAARVFAGLAILFGLYALVWQLPLLRWIVEGAKALHDLGWPGVLATFAAIYLLSLLPVPIIPVVVPMPLAVRVLVLVIMIVMVVRVMMIPMTMIMTMGMIVVARALVMMEALRPGGGRIFAEHQ